MDRFRVQLLVDVALGIRYLSEPAAAFLARHHLFCVSRDRLGCADPLAQRALAEGFRTHLARSRGRSVIRLPGTRGPRYLAFVERASTISPSAGGGLHMVVLHDMLEPAPRLDPETVAECFGLTRAESVVAIWLAEGANAKQIAHANGVSPATVRTQIKRVLEKTCMPRHACLVRLLLSLPTCAWVQTDEERTCLTHTPPSKPTFSPTGTGRAALNLVRT